MNEHVTALTLPVGYSFNSTARAAVHALGDYAASHEIAWIYDKWFVRPLPGRALHIPIGVELRRTIEVLGRPAPSRRYFGAALVSSRTFAAASPADCV